MELFRALGDVVAYSTTVDKRYANFCMRLDSCRDACAEQRGADTSGSPIRAAADASRRPRMSAPARSRVSVRVLSDTRERPPENLAQLLVVGNGMAGVRFVEELHTRGSQSFQVTILGNESHGGYNRIMLSGVLGGFRSAGAILTHTRDWYQDRRFNLHLETQAATIDRAQKTVTCVDGSRHRYDALVIATGSRPFVPPIDGLDAPHVYVLRTLADCERIRTAANGARSAVVLGGGLLGLETASGLTTLGVATTVVHRSTLIERQFDATAGGALAVRFTTLGITIRPHVQAVRAYNDTTGRGIELSGGERIAADIIVVCCGSVPNAEIARDAGLAVQHGIIVDDGLQTSDPAIFAIGECAQHRGVTYGFVEPLWEQSAILADRLTGGQAAYTGSRVGTKLKVAGVNVIALGERDPQPGDDVSVALDSPGRFKRAIARNGVIVGAQVVGDAKAVAALTQAFKSRALLPGSLAAFMRRLHESNTIPH